MKKSTLQIAPQYEFDLLGLVAPLKDYKMAWLINRIMGINLVKVADLRMEFLKQPDLLISQYVLKKEHGFIQLLRNRSYSNGGLVGYLVPELKYMDYFLILQDYTLETDINVYIDNLSTSNLIQNVVKLDISKLKSKENLLTY
ncbi:MAG TPA: IPExxxVDY family protein [Cyclobacteriaceae bacterium]|nr:IPExxxVDY family protein [Cyclobacteriaceae bacterium]